MDEKELFLKSFEDKLKKKLDKKTLSQLSKGTNFDDDMTSSDYEKFRVETLPNSINFYEKYCNFSQKILNVKGDEKTNKKINSMLYTSHLNCSADGVLNASILTSFIIVITGLLFLVTLSTTIGFGLIIIGLISYIIMQNIPSVFLKKHKAKANDQVIVAIFYIVAFMRFNSNFELAVHFAANYLSPPLSLDFKRILWELENAKYPNIKQAFDDYLEYWRDDNLEFLESIYLIESSLFESEEFRRISLLDKSLDIILQGNYERMLHFSQELRGKVSAFNMIGVVLPILGLIILPLAASFGDPRSTWEVVLLLYDIVFPLGVAYYGFLIIFNRPSSVNSLKFPDLKQFKNLQKIPIKISKEKTVYISPKWPSIAIFTLFMFIGLLPLIFHQTGTDKVLNDVVGSIFPKSSPFSIFQEYKEIDKSTIYMFGPYGEYPGILSLFIPLSFAFGIGYYLKSKYKNLIKLRDKTKQLETEFPSATFQLGNRINEGISAELAFGAVSETMKGTQAGAFFSNIDSNIKFNGMSVEAAIFDSEKGAINNYPSDLVVSSMKIFIRAIEKGPDIAAKTLIDLAKYLSEIHMSNERMKDLLAESLGSMKSQASYLAPLISAVVISIVSLVTMIMGSLAKATTSLQQTEGPEISSFLGDSIPTYLFQSVVGMYIVMLIAILVFMVVNLESGDDPILMKYEIGSKLMSGLTKYSVIVTLGIIGFSFIGSKVLGTIV